MNGASVCACKGYVGCPSLKFLVKVKPPILCPFLPVFIVQSSEMLNLSVSDNCTLQICNTFEIFFWNLYMANRLY